MANVLPRFLNGISRQSQNLQKDHESFRLANTVNDLLGVMLDSYFSAGWQPEDQDEVMLQALYNLIQDHHRDPELNPQKIAGMQGISVRQIQRIFQQNGTTAMEQLKIMRLKATRRDLDEPAYSRRTVADIARSHGYRNAGVFTRNFKQAFGLSPRAYRQEKNAAQ